MAGVETMFAARTTSWDGMGNRVSEAKSSEEAIDLAGLNWTVESKPIFLGDGTQINGSFANVRSSDNKPLGIVGERYKIVQNSEAFAFTDALLGEGVKYETAGSIKEGKIIWLLAKMPEPFDLLGDKVDPYLVFTNTHDGSGSVRVAVTNVRVICQNTLNLALRTAKRTWTARHTGNIQYKLDDALQTLELTHQYIEATKTTFEELHKHKMDEFTLYRTVNNIVPIAETMTDRQKTNAESIREDILFRYKNAPDLRVLDQTGARLVQAVADTVDHMTPFRETGNYKENKFKRTIEGNELLDKAVGIILAA